MPQPDAYNFDYKELARLMIRAAGVKEGYWGIRVAFGLQVTNVGPDKTQLAPGAILLLQNVGLQRFPEENALSVDAATVWTEE